MRTDGHRRSDNFEDRGTGASGGSARGVPSRALVSILRRVGLKGVVVFVLAMAAVYFFAPVGIKQMVFGLLMGGVPGEGTASGASVCEASETNAAACDFSRVVLASTEDVWTAQFQQGRLPRYQVEPGAYVEPTLVVFGNAVETGGCGSASADTGPFYCPADRKLYIDPSFYQVMESRLRAPGDFAQAYVIAHEVGHHVQNSIGAMRVRPAGESEAQVSVRVELQADCLAGVWGHTARASLSITDEDLAEAVNAAHAIGDDTLGHSDSRQFTHGSGAQRIRWFRRGFDSGDARQCDTFAVSDPRQL